MRFECRNASLNSDKFWTFEIQDGNRVGFAYGRRGTAGQTMTKTYDTMQRLMDDLERLVSEKLEKGYLPVEADGEPAKNIEVFGIRMQRSIRAAMREQQPGRFDPLRGPVGESRAAREARMRREQGSRPWWRGQMTAPRPPATGSCPHAKLVRGALGYLCDACGESLPAGPGAAPTEGILVKTKRRITFE